MALKDLLISTLPQYCESLPSGKTVCFRPLIVSEEKALILAKATGNKNGILKTLENILTECCSDFKKSELKKLKLCDLEYLFLLIRAKSIGEIEGFTLKCPQTNETIQLKINLLNDVKITQNTPSNKIKLNENLLLVMNEPTADILFKTPDYDTDEDSFYKFIGLCLKQVQTKTEIKDCKDIKEEELTDFIKALTAQQLKLITNYFDSLSKIEIIKTYKTKDETERSIVIKGLFNYINFFFEHLNIENLYKQNFQLKYYHNYDLNELEMMIPWERIIYVEQIKEHLQEEKNIKIRNME
jgi:hypothetical protein